MSESEVELATEAEAEVDLRVDHEVDGRALGFAFFEAAGVDLAFLGGRPTDRLATVSAALRFAMGGRWKRARRV